MSFTLFQWTVFLMQLFTLNVITSNSPNGNDIYAAIDRKEYDAVKDLARWGGYKRTNELGESPLYYASRKNNLTALNILIDAGADVNTKNAEGYVALTGAVANKRETVVRELIRAGADIHAIDSSLKTPLQRMTDPTCHGNFVHWGTETMQLIEKPGDTTLVDVLSDTAEKFTCPMIAMSAQGENHEWYMWRLGYPSFPADKLMHDQQVMLLCDVDIKNNNASLHLANVFYDSCETNNNAWVCADHDGETQYYTNPTMTPRIVGDSNFNVSTDSVITSKAVSSNLQPNGSVYLSAEAELPLQVAYLMLPEDYIFESCKIYQGDWYCERSQ